MGGFLTPAELEALALSFRVAATAVLLTLPFAFFCALLLARTQFRGKAFVDGLVHLPLVLPPVAIGYLLLVSFGTRAPIGAFLLENFGIRFVFSWTGAALASAILTNYQLPDPELAVVVPVSVSDASDLAKVEAVTTAVAQEVMADVEGAVATFEPSVRFNALGDGAITASVTLRARQFSDQDLIRHELIKRLQVRYQAEGIETPKRTVYSVPVSLPVRSRARK